MRKSVPLDFCGRIYFNRFILISLFHKCVSMMGMLLCIQLFVKPTSVAAFSIFGFDDSFSVRVVAFITLHCFIDPPLIFLGVKNGRVGSPRSRLHTTRPFRLLVQTQIFL